MLRVVQSRCTYISHSYTTSDWLHASRHREPYLLRLCCAIAFHFPFRTVPRAVEDKAHDLTPSCTIHIFVSRSLNIFSSDLQRNSSTLPNFFRPFQPGRLNSIHHEASTIHRSDTTSKETKEYSRVHQDLYHLRQKGRHSLPQNIR
jgi:hypothetical protein